MSILHVKLLIFYLKLRQVTWYVIISQGFPFGLYHRYPPELVYQLRKQLSSSGAISPLSSLVIGLDVRQFHYLFLSVIISARCRLSDQSVMSVLCVLMVILWPSRPAPPSNYPLMRLNDFCPMPNGRKCELLVRTSEPLELISSELCGDVPNWNVNAVVTFDKNNWHTTYQRSGTRQGTISSVWIPSQRTLPFSAWSRLGMFCGLRLMLTTLHITRTVGCQDILLNFFTLIGNHSSPV